MLELSLSADELINSLLGLSKDYRLCLLDSCGVSHLNSHLLVAGISPVQVLEITNDDSEKTLEILDQMLSNDNLSAILTISYNFGLKINKIRTRHHKSSEPDIFLALFDVLIIHDYNLKKTFLTGNTSKFEQTAKLLLSNTKIIHSEMCDSPKLSFNFTVEKYLQTVEEIQEFIRRGDTYQTNLTQQIRAKSSQHLLPEIIFSRLRKFHPAPFASFIRRKNDVVISASPERFFRIENQKISTSPIKGTRRRGKNTKEDSVLRNELINSEKDRAENIMIVDLLRNDIGRICEYGSVKVEKLCDVEEHPSLFHLVSTVNGKLRAENNFSDILRAIFPCGSITGAPKIKTMKIIDELEPDERGLSMGAIGFFTSKNVLGVDNQKLIDLSVAIRTMTVRDNEAVFNVGGGIVIDSSPQDEYEETLTKAKALLSALSFNK